MRNPTRTLLILAICLALPLLVAACVSSPTGQKKLHQWWTGYGAVLPHDSFPADCKICHLGDGWNTLTDYFNFDHEKETGLLLEGAHAEAQCLRCHNDRGPVTVFAAKGCVGCHEDFHSGDLGPDCTLCHQQQTWEPTAQIELHNRTRFPLTGAHLLTSCYRCHPGGLVGNFVPVDTECVTCHVDDLANATNPPHIGLGYVDHCDRCHMPTTWNQATVR